MKAQEKTYCLPIGHPELAKLKIHSEITLEKDLWLGRVKFPAGCVVNTAYGPEFGGDTTELQRNKFRIISSAKCDSGIQLGQYKFSNAFFDGDFCLEGYPALLADAVVCGVKLRKGDEAYFDRGKPNCKLIKASQQTGQN